MLLNVVNDVHIGAPNALMPQSEFEDKINYFTNRKRENLYSIGDNFDFANTKRGNLLNLDLLKNRVLSNPNVRHIDGNHERGSKKNDTIKIGNILLAHGDFEFWGQEKAVAYRSKPQGAGFLKRGLIVKAIAAFERDFESTISGDFLSRASILAKINKCHTYICGHKHNEEVYDNYYDGVRIVVLPRGFNTVEVTE